MADEATQLTLGAPVVEETPVVEPVEIVETAETTDEPVETAPETPDDTTPEIVEEEVSEPVTFDVADPEFSTKITEVLEKYELPPDVQAVIEAYKTKADTPNDNFAEYKEYGEPDDIKALLDRQALLDSVSETSAGGYRPNTDKFVETLSPEKAQWMWFDLSRLPSEKYPGLNQFQEGLADSFAVEGDTVGAVLARYQQAVEALKSGVSVQSSVPEYIPQSLHEAYWSLSKDEQEELAQFDPSLDRIEYDEGGRAKNIDEAIRARKLDTLAKIQRGIEGDKYLKQQEVESQQVRQQNFHQSVVTKQQAFYDALRTSFAEDLMKSVTFSPDPKLQTILAYQNVALLTQAFSDDSDGAFARKALADAGIRFDEAKAAQLIKDVEQASVALASAEQIRDASGHPINQIEINKAKAYFERAGKNWQDFANDILKQQADLTSTGTKKAVDKAADEKIEKKKLEIKARPSTKGTPSVVSKNTEARPPAHIRYGTPEWDGWFADQALEEQAKKTRAYA